MRRGLTYDLASQVAGQLTAHDALEAHHATSWASTRTPSPSRCRPPSCRR